PSTASLSACEVWRSWARLATFFGISSSVTALVNALHRIVQASRMVRSEDYARAGQQHAGLTGAMIQLVLQQARGQARLGERGEVHASLDHGAKLPEQLPRPDHPENHFVFDHTKWIFYAATPGRRCAARPTRTARRGGRQGLHPRAPGHRRPRLALSALSARRGMLTVRRGYGTWGTVVFKCP